MKTCIIIIIAGIIFSALCACVAPERTYNVYIHCQGSHNQVTIEVKADVPQDYDVTANTNIDAAVDLVP